jgi:hypothetical protein
MGYSFFSPVGFAGIFWTYAPPELSDPAITKTLLTDIIERANQQVSRGVCSALAIKLK